MPILYPPPAWTTLSDSVILWHGCTGNDYAQINNHGRIDPTTGRPDSDFGRGFYATTRERQARQWAWKRYYDLPLDQQGGGNQPITLRFRVPRDKLSQLESLCFVLGDFASEDYWALVHHCRQSTPAAIRHHHHPDPTRKGWYDIVIGPVAAFWRQRVAMADADQISFHTDRAVDLLNDLMKTGKASDFQVIPVP